MARCVLINPNILVQRQDRFTTGIIYMPVGLAYVAAALRGGGHQTSVIDAFAEAPRQVRIANGFLVQGLTAEQVVERISIDTDAVFVYANQVSNHVSVISILKAIKESRPGIVTVVLENTQAVTAYALRPVAEQLFAAGADYLLSGEGERRSVLFLAAEGPARRRSPGSHRWSELAGT